MLANEASTSFVLTLQSVPPFVVENMLALALVVIFSVPLIVRIQSLLENTAKAMTTGTLEHHRDHCDQRQKQTNPTVVMHYPIPVKLDPSSNSDLNIQLASMRTTSSTPIVKRSLESLKKKGTKENRDEQLQEQYKRNLRKMFLKKQKTCLPLERSSSFLATNTQLPIIDISAFDYDSYRYKLIEMSLKRQYGNRQAPGNVVLNSIHLNSIGSQSGIQLSEKYSHSLFDLIEEYYDATKTITKKEKEYLHPLDHFLAKDAAKPDTADAETATDQKQLPIVAFREEPNVPAVVSLTPSGQRKTREGTKRDSKPKEVSSRTEKVSLAGNQHPKATDQNEKDCAACPSMSSSDAGSSYSTSKPRERFVRSRASSLSSRSRTTGIPSQASQLYPSGNSKASVNPNCESPQKSSVKTIKPKLSSRPRSSGGRFDWEVPDLPGLSCCDESTEKEESTVGKVQERPKTANATYNSRTTSEKEKLPDPVLPVLESFVDLQVYVPCDDFDDVNVDCQKDHQRSIKEKPSSCDKVNTDGVTVVAKTSSSGTKTPANRRHSSVSRLPVHAGSYKTKIRTLTDGAKPEALARKSERLDDKSLGNLEKKSVSVIGKIRRPRTAGSVQSHCSSLSPKVELSLEAIQSNDDSSNIFGVPTKESESARSKELSTKHVTSNISQLKTPRKLASLSGKRNTALRSSTNKTTSSIKSRVPNNSADSSKKGPQEDKSSKRPFLRARSGRYGAPKLNVNENEPKESSMCKTPNSTKHMKSDGDEDKGKEVGNK